MLRSFQHESKNRPFVKEIFKRYIGQGLYSAGHFDIEGHPNNKYIMKVLHFDRIRTIIFRESDVKEWTLTSTSEDDDEPRDSLKFEVDGLLDGESYKFMSYDRDDYDHIFVHPFHFELKVQDISICDHAEYPNQQESSTRLLDSCNVCKEFDVEYKKVQKQPTLTDMKRVSYDTFIKESGNYYIVGDGCIIPFFKQKTLESQISEIVINGTKTIMKHEYFEDKDTYGYIDKEFGYEPYNTKIECDYYDNLQMLQCLNDYYYICKT